MMKKVIVLALWALGCAGAFGEDAVLTDFSGTVELKNPGASAWVPARKGAAIAGGTLISTGFRSSAVITAGSSVITVQSLTRLSFTEIRSMQENEEISITLQAGRIRARVNPPGEGGVTFTVKSPMATASVRGTVFEFGTRDLEVIEGTVLYRGTAGRAAAFYRGDTGSAAGPRGIASGPGETRAAALLPNLPAGSEAKTGAAAGYKARAVEAAAPAAAGSSGGSGSGGGGGGGEASGGGGRGSGSSGGGRAAVKW
jgi:hypothetical protein